MLAHSSGIPFWESFSEAVPKWASPTAALNRFQTVLTNQNAVFLGFWAVWGCRLVVHPG